MEKVTFNGWENSIRFANGQVELIVVTAVGPRIARFAFEGERNLFAELPGQQGGRGEPKWMIRGGHRFWIAPEEMPKTYELDNEPVPYRRIAGGVRTLQPPGRFSGVSKTMDITLATDRNEVKIVHTLTNCRKRTVRLAPWALTAMAQGGLAIIPLPKKIPHTERLTHNQEWSLWGYTDLSDPRWTLGSRYIFFRQNRKRGPNKIGIAHREGWVAYQLGEFVFVKRFDRKEGATYPDGGVNFETFSNEDFLELESLGPLVDLPAGKSVQHVERWELYREIPRCRTEDDVDRHILPLVEKRMCCCQA